VPEYFGLREAAHSLLEAKILAVPDLHELALLLEIEPWVAAHWRDGRLKITGRLFTNGHLGDRIEIAPHSDRHIYWHEGAEVKEPRIYERERAEHRGAVTGEWRGLEIGGEDLARLQERLLSECSSVSAPSAAFAEAAVPEPEAAQPESAVPVDAPGWEPAPAAVPPPTAPPPVDDQPLQSESPKRKPRRALKAAAMLEWLDQQTDRMRQRTPTFLASQYCKEHPGTCTRRWAFDVFSKPEQFRGR